MIESALTLRNVALKNKITIKTVVSILLVALAVGLPLMTHAIGGTKAGVTWLPMYLPILAAGCVLGAWWGIGVAVVAPLVSFALTSIWGSGMPTLARLPFMIAELVVFALVSGLFSKRIFKQKWLAFPAVLLAQICGRAFFILLVVIFQNYTSLTLSGVLAQVKQGLWGILAQAIIIPILAIILSNILSLHKDKN